VSLKRIARARNLAYPKRQIPGLAFCRTLDLVRLPMREPEMFEPMIRYLRKQGYTILEVKQHPKERKSEFRNI